MRPADIEHGKQLEQGLLDYDKRIRPLRGVRLLNRRKCFVEQMLDSIHRVKYAAVLQTRNLSRATADPASELFDPVKAAIINQRLGQLDEAFWLTFLFVHFGKNARGGYRYAREVYGQLGAKERWDWAATSADPVGFRKWLHKHQARLMRNDSPGGFGNHRKYESLDAYSARGTGAAVATYIRWVTASGNHPNLINQALREVKGDPKKAFDSLYRSMSAVASFGRMARFDYLTMLGKLGLAPIEPGLVYMQNATGPLKGARLLFGGKTTTPIDASTLDSWLIELDSMLGVGMQVLEDSLCNWQKSPDKFKRFLG